MSGLLYRFGGLCARRAWLVLLVWACIVAAVGAGWLLVGARTSNDIRLPGTETQQATDFLAREFPPQQNGQSAVVFHASDGALTDPAAKRAVQASVRRMARVRHVTSVTSPFARGARSLLMSGDGKTAIAQVLLDVNGGQVTRALASEVMAAAMPAREAGIQVEAGGVLGVRLSEETSRRSEIIGLTAGIVILAITFGALVAAGMPIITAIVALVTGLGLIGLLGHLADIPVVAPTLATMLGLGVGIDYALFIVFRYRDELHAGAEVREAISRSMGTSGSAVVFAGVTVIIALLSLLVARVPLLGAMGYASALAVLVAMLTSITMLPAVLAVVGRRIDALPLPWRRSAGRSAREDNVWARWSGAVTRHPWIALTASLAVLLPLAAPTLTLILGQEDIGAWPASTTQRRAYDLITAGLGPGADGRLLVATRFSPAAEPSVAYTAKRARAERLARGLKEDARRLKRQGAALERRATVLKAEKADLVSRAAALKAQQAALEAKAAPLLARKGALLAQRRQLLAQKSALLAEQHRLAAEAAALEADAAYYQAQIAAMQAQIAQTTDPVELAKLQAELAVLVHEAQQVQAQAAALQERAAALTKQGERLAAKGKQLEATGRQLQADSAALTAQGAALTAQGARLAAEGAALKKRAARLEIKAAALKREKRRLQRQARRARVLRRDLVEMLTDAGGAPRATDPRLVHLQDALAAAPGVESVSPPSVNESGSAAVFALTAATRPADPVTSDLVRRLRTTVIPEATAGAGITAYVGGVTAAYDDLATIISSRLPLVIGVVLALSFVVLLVAFRSVLVPLKAILCNLLAVGAAFGILTAFFQWGWGLPLIGLDNAYGTVPIASYVPLIMFAVLFGMSTDYEVFLISQIFHAHAEGLETREAVRAGVDSSARVITAAAFIMVTVFVSFILTSDPVLKEFAVGLSVAILLDATIVRLVIVPATMVLLGEWNWWLPRWLQWLPQVDLPDERAAAAPTAAAVSTLAAPGVRD